jgi:hypothetical protein
MEAVLLGAAALACPVGMGAMMWFMARGMKKPKDEASPASVEKDEALPASVETLREEHRRLGVELERMEDSSAPVGGARS